MSKDPYADKPVQRPAYESAGDQRTYRWNGKDYYRVTEILSISKGGDALTHWHGKQAALRSASWLVHAGLFTPDTSTMAGQELEKFVDGEAIRAISEGEAIEKACDWMFNYLEGDRNRDHASAVGRIAHHASYDFAIGARVKDKELIEYLAATAENLGLVSDEVAERFASLGVERRAIVLDLAHHALPYWLYKKRWIETFKPSWNQVGLGISVFSDDCEYAGTPDDDFNLHQHHWEQAGFRWPFGKPMARVISDDKTTNQTRVKTHAAQIAAYTRGEFFGDYTDQSETPVPEYDGAMVLYLSKEPDAKLIQPWTFLPTEIDDLFAGFCGLNDWFRMVNDMPRAVRSRQVAKRKEKKGDRTCPI